MRVLSAPTVNFVLLLADHEVLATLHHKATKWNCEIIWAWVFDHNRKGALLLVRIECLLPYLWSVFALVARVIPQGRHVTESKPTSRLPCSVATSIASSRALSCTQGSTGGVVRMVDVWRWRLRTAFQCTLTDLRIRYDLRLRDSKGYSWESPDAWR